MLAVLSKGILAVDIKKTKLKLKQSKYLNLNNLLKILVLASQPKKVYIQQFNLENCLQHNIHKH